MVRMNQKGKLLQRHFGYHSFRSGQEALIDAQLFENHGKTPTPTWVPVFSQNRFYSFTKSVPQSKQTFRFAF